MKNALILHGTASNANDQWFAWLRKELEKKGYKVWVPNLPGADEPDILRYNKFIFPKWKFDEESIVVGHSSGAVEILGILQELLRGVIIKKAILVAGFKDDLDYDPVKNMFKYQFDWGKIKKHAKEFVFIHSDNDPYVRVKHGEFFKKNLGGELVILPGQGHFSISTMGNRYRQFPELLKHFG